MKAVISSTYDDQYLFFLPIVTWCWNKLGVDVICFLPHYMNPKLSEEKFDLISSTLWDMRSSLVYFKCTGHKEATYSQCSRLYAAALDLPEDEMLVVSDIDMALFQIPHHYDGRMTVFGNDLVPVGQVPMCYLSGPVKEWRRRFNINGRTAQEMLDELLGGIECDNMRGNYWSKDQQEARDRIIGGAEHAMLIPRARPGTFFASNRVDRDDINWRSYCGPDLIDAHLWRPGYEENNFANILELLSIQYPNENFEWLTHYKNEYIKLL